MAAIVESWNARVLNVKAQNPLEFNKNLFKSRLQYHCDKSIGVCIGLFKFEWLLF